MGSRHYRHHHHELQGGVRRVNGQVARIEGLAPNAIFDGSHFVGSHRCAREVVAGPVLRITAYGQRGDCVFDLRWSASSNLGGESVLELECRLFSFPANSLVVR